MSSNDDKNKDKKNSNDPFDFFKLSTEPNKNSNNNSGDKKPKIPFWVIPLAIVAVITLSQFFFTSRTDNTIAFSQFRRLIEAGQIVRVEMEQNYFYGYGPERCCLYDFKVIT